MSVNNVVTDRHLYLEFENNEREVVNSACYFVSGVLFENNGSDSEIAQEIDDSRAELKSHSHLLKKLFICFSESPSKMIKKTLFHLKSSFCSQNIQIFVLNLWA